jgi:branched-subunit amino acid transport protein
LTWQEFWLISGMALVTFACRYPMLALVSRVTLPAGVVDALKFIPPAVLTAIIMPAVMAPTGRLALELGNPYLVAALASCWVAWRTKHLLMTIVVGITVWWGWQWMQQVWSYY